LHAALPQMVHIAKMKFKVPSVAIATNGQLLTVQLIQQLVQNGIDEIILSMHGVTKASYEFFQPPASYEKLHGVLKELTRISKEANAHFSLRINYTLNPDNFEELNGFFETFGQYKIDTLQIRPVFDLGKTRYTNRDLKPHQARIRKICDGVQAECVKRGITLLRPAIQEDEKTNLGAAILLPLVYRYVSPEVVWRDDFRWQTESYEAYCRRSGWSRNLLRMVFWPTRKVEEYFEWSKRSLRYDVS